MSDRPMISPPEGFTLSGLIASGRGARLLSMLARLLLRSRGMVFEWSFAAGAFGIALGLRLLLDGWLPPGFPFLTFFLAVLVTAVMASIRAGTVVAVAGGIGSWFFFVAPEYSFALSTGTVVALAFYVLITGSELVFIAATDLALRRLRDAHSRAERLAQDRELLLAEMQHRVSNNLATVAALLRAQSGQLRDDAARAALGAAQQRIMTVSRLQRRLHQPDTQDVELDAYLSEITHDTLESAGIDAGVIDTEFASVRTSQDTALPLGLIVCELLLNAIEHAGDAPGFRVRVRLVPAGDDLQLTVSDNGPGLPPDFDLAEIGSLGLNVAQQFAGKLGGDLTLEPGRTGGTQAMLRFPSHP